MNNINFESKIFYFEKLNFRHITYLKHVLNFHPTSEIGGMTFHPLTSGSSERAFYITLDLVYIEIY